MNDTNPKQITFPIHGDAVVTCLLLAHNRIISASDDHFIHVYCPLTGKQLRSLEGHEGGVWALAATKNTLVSGSTDRTVRVWNLSNGRCTHVFGGHTSTVRCLAIVKPEWLDIEIEGGGIKREKWPKRSLIVTGSRDHSLRVWTLPRPDEEEYMCYGANDSEGDPAEVSQHLFFQLSHSLWPFRRTRMIIPIICGCSLVMNKLCAPWLLVEEP